MTPQQFKKIFQDVPYFPEFKRIKFGKIEGVFYGQDELMIFNNTVFKKIEETGGSVAVIYRTLNEKHPCAMVVHWQKPRRKTMLERLENDIQMSKL